MSAESKSPLVFAEAGVKINSKIYIHSILEKDLMPWVEATFGTRLWTLTQDGAPSHTSNVTQTWLKKKNPGFLSKEFWPPSIPDGNPLDFCLGSILEDKACKTSYKNVDDLSRLPFSVHGMESPRKWSVPPSERSRIDFLSLSRPKVAISSKIKLCFF